MMVSRSRGIDFYDVAINPTRQEWKINFREGAAGVFMQDGTLVVGDGPHLDHISLVNMAALDIENEKYRLQITDAVYVELWEEGLGDEDEEENVGTPAWVEKHTKYKKEMRQSIAQELLASPFVKRLNLPVGVMIEDSLGTNDVGSCIWLKEIY